MTISRFESIMMADDILRDFLRPEISEFLDWFLLLDRPLQLMLMSAATKMPLGRAEELKRLIETVERAKLRHMFTKK